MTGVQTCALPIWRARAGAVLSGIGTVLADNPRLDVRDHPVARQPLRVILDARLQTPPEARLLGAPLSPVLILAGTDQGPQADALRARGAQVEAVELTQDRLALPDVLAALARLSLNEVHLECGPRLSGAWLASGLVDELLVYQAPVFLGPGRAMAELPPAPDLVSLPRWRLHEVVPVGEDLRLRLRP